MTKEAEARKGRAGHSVAISGEKLKKWCVLVHFGASQPLGTRLRRAPSAVRKRPVRGFAAYRRAGFPRPRCIKEIEKVMQNDAK